jgi:hypothetical protein
MENEYLIHKIVMDVLKFQDILLEMMFLLVIS